MGGVCGKRKYAPNTVDVLEEKEVNTEKVNQKSPTGDVLEEKKVNTEKLNQKSPTDDVLEEKKVNAEKLNQNAENTNEEQTFLVGEVGSIRDDKFTEVKISPDKSVLVAKHDGGIFAIGAKCPHAGASLINGVLMNGKVRCPWHAACFDLKTGDLEDFPGFDCIPSYPVTEEGSNLYVKVNPKKIIERRLKPMKKVTENDKTIVIIGSGPSGYSCAQTLREEGFAGKILMVTSDPYLPYDRTKLSKKLGCTIDEIQLRNDTFYKEFNIEIKLSAKVQNLDVLQRTIFFEPTTAFSPIRFDSLYISVGMSPRPLPGSQQFENVHTLYSLADSQEIAKKAKGKEIVLIGSSFISMELAELLSPIATKIQILSRSNVPYNVAFGDLTGDALLTHFLKKLPNVTFHKETAVKELLDTDGLVHSIVTTKDETLTSDLVIVAIGGVPSTAFLKDGAIQLDSKSGAILVNEFMETNCQRIFAGGDAVAFPFDLAPHDVGTVAHWQVASRHGKTAALNILGRQESMKKLVPFFWTNVCGLQVRYIGFGEGYDETVVFGNPESLRFCIVYQRNGVLRGVCCVGCDNLASELALVFENNMEWVNSIPEAITRRFPK